MLLQYQIGVVGAESVSRALSGIEARLQKHNANVQRMTRRQGAGLGRNPSANPLVQAKKEAAALDREQRKQQQYWERAHRKSIDQRIRESERASRAEVKAAQTAAREKARVDQQAARKAVAEQKKAAKEQERAARQTMASRRRFSEGTFGRIGSSVVGTTKAVGALAGGALALGGGFAVAGAVQTQASEAAAASRLANQAAKNGEDPRVLKGQLLQESRQVKGFSGAEALAGMEEFVTKTGDLDTARKIIGDLGQLSLATGANLGDLGATAGQAFTVLSDQISDPAERVRQLNELMRTLAQQGAMGAVEIRDLAQDFGKLGAATRSFEGDAPALLRSMGAFAQIAVRSGGAQNSADAATAASRLSNDIVMHKDRFKKLGVDIKSKKDPTKLRDPMEIMADTLDKTGGDIEKTAGLLGLESVKIFRGLGATYSAAEQKEKGSGREAIMAEFKKYAGATLSDKDVKTRADSRLDDADLKMKELQKEFNTRIGPLFINTMMKLAPEFEKLLPYVEQAAKFFTKLVEAFAQDPIGGMVKLIAAKAALDLAMNGIAEGSKKLAGALGEATNNIAKQIPGVGTGGSNVAGAAATGFSLGVATATFIVTTGIFNFEKGEADMNKAGALLSAARDSKDPAVARQARDEISKMAASRETMSGTESFISGALDVAQLASPIGWAMKAAGQVSDSANFDEDKAARWISDNTINSERGTQLNTFNAMSEELNKLIPVLERNTAATKANTDANALNRGDGPSVPKKVP